MGRYILRWNTAGAIGIPHGIKRFGVEDGLHLLALLAAITYVALQSSGLALFIKLEIYNQTHKDRLNLEDENHFFHIRFGAILVFWICLYSVKFAFLMFYRTLFWVSHPFRKYWYAVSAFTLLSFLVSFLACFWVCGWPVNPLNLRKSSQDRLFDSPHGREKALLRVTTYPRTMSSQALGRPKQHRVSVVCHKHLIIGPE